MEEDEKIMDKAEEIAGRVDFKSKYVDFERDGAEFGRVIKECFRNGTVMTAGELCKKLMALECDKRKDNYSIGLHNIDYSLSTDDSTYTRRIYNFPIRSGETTIYYDESFLVDVSFNITIEPSFDGDLNNMEKK